MGDALHQAPTVVVTTKTCGGLVVDVCGIKNRSNLVHGNPPPCKFDIGSIALLGDTSDADQFAAGSGNAEGLFLGIAGGDETLKGIHAGWCERDIPAGRWRKRRSAGSGG